MEARLARPVRGTSKRIAVVAPLEVIAPVFREGKLFSDPEPVVVIAPADMLEDVLFYGRILTEEFLGRKASSPTHDVEQR